jgi:hypothetical protein
MKPWIAVAAMTFVSGPALALEPGPVCREPSVVDEMAREIRAKNYYTYVDPRLVTEQQTPAGNVVRCQVCVLATPYNQTTANDQPVRQCEPHGFDVRILPSGFLVTDTP